MRSTSRWTGRRVWRSSKRFAASMRTRPTATSTPSTNASEVWIRSRANRMTSVAITSSVALIAKTRHRSGSCEKRTVRCCSTAYRRRRPRGDGRCDCVWRVAQPARAPVSPPPVGGRASTAGYACLNPRDPRPPRRDQPPPRRPPPPPPPPAPPLGAPPRAPLRVLAHDKPQLGVVADLTSYLVECLRGPSPFLPRSHTFV